MQHRLVNLSDNVPKSTLTLRGPGFSFRTVTFIEVREVVKQLKNKSSQDIYNLTVPLLKLVREFLIYPLTRLINSSIQNGYFPHALKEALVIPVYKNKGDRNDVGNYRPISLLPVISKVYEKCIAKQIIEYYESNNLFANVQHGFRQGRSTMTSITDFVTSVLEGFENREYTSTIFCDLSKAFDCVPHDHLIAKLKTYNFDINSINLVRSYLSDRFQQVRIQGITSKKMPLTVGVPQGSILGPLLFLIYINDLPEKINDVSFNLFADDTTVSVRLKESEEITQRTLEVQSSIKAWFLQNNLVLNEAKTNKMIFALREWDTDMETQESVRFLGVTLDSTLRWNTHISTLAAKVSRSVFLLRNLVSRVSKDVLRTAYFGLCHSLFSYGTIVWGQAADAHRIFSLQRKAVRIVAGLAYRQDCRHAFIELKILTLPCICIHEYLIYAKTNNNQFRTNGDHHTYNTRNRDDLATPFYRLKKCQLGPTYLAIKYFNVLPISIRNFPLAEFKKIVKQILLEKAFYSVSEYFEHCKTIF